MKRLAEIETGIPRRSRFFRMLAERRGLWLTLVGIFVLAVVTIASIKPLVRSMVERKAQRMGLAVSIDTLSLGFGCVWLEDVKVEIPKVPALKLSARAIRAAVRGFGAGDIAVQGGTVELDGTMSEVRKQLGEWRADRAPASEGAEQGGRRLEFSGIDFVWRNALGPKSEITIWGAAGQRDGTNETYRFDLARFGSAEASIELGRFAADVVRQHDQRALRSVTAETLTLQTSLDALPAIARRLAGGDTEEPSGAPNTRTNPKGSAVAASPGQSFVLSRLRKGIELLRPKLQSHLLPDAKIALEQVTLRLTQHEQALSLGPASLQAALEKDRFVAKVAPLADASKETLALGLDLPLSSGDTVVSLEGGPISLARLGAHEGDMWLRNVEHTTLSARTRAVLPASAGRVSIEANGEIHDWAILQPKLAPDPVSGERLGFKVSASVAEDGSAFDLKELMLNVGNVNAKLSGSIVHQDDTARIELRGEIPLVACQAMLDSVPTGLLGALSDVKVGGTFSFAGNLDLDTAHLDAMRIGWDAKNDCRISANRPEIAPERFRGRFEYYATDSDGVPVLRATGPQSEDWTPLLEVSPYLETAVIICEDSRFRRHHGFDEEAIHNAIVANVKAGRFIRGASTLSMQLAKNLYLGREKTLSRKLQEAVLTTMLEQALSKDEILELYFNVVEFGPNVFGIRQAAKHYFNVLPRDLTLMQSLYLASILPNPKYSHLDAEGNLSEHWAEYLRKLMHIAYKIHRISEEELEQGLNETLASGEHGDAGAEAPSEEAPSSPEPDPGP